MDAATAVGYFRFGRYMCVAWPKTASAASMSVSESVGWAWIVSARSRATAAVSTARAASPISSPRRRRRCRLPGSRSVLGSTISFVSPSVRPIDWARPEAPHGKRTTIDFAILGFGLRFGQAAPGDFGIGEDDRRNRHVVERGRLAGERIGDDFGFARRLVGQHRFAGDVADREDVRVGRPPLRIDRDEAFGIDLDFRVFEPQVLAVRTAADRNQHAVEFLFDRFAVFSHQPGRDRRSS